MGQNILTPKQTQFLERIQIEPEVVKRFYLTGGTALSAFYLQHRLSYDIDLFTEKEEVDQKLVEAFLKTISPQLSVVQIKRSQFMGLFSYTLVYEDGDELKVDFSYYPFPRIQEGINFKKLKIDSVYDIAANKIHTIFTKPRSRDYLDLYFIMRKYKYPLNKLIIDAKAKFDWHIDKVTLASQFLRVKDVDESSLVVVPFDNEDMENFFLSQAKLLEGDIFN